LPLGLGGLPFHFGLCRIGPLDSNAGSKFTLDFDQVESHGKSARRRERGRAFPSAKNSLDYQRDRTSREIPSHGRLIKEILLKEIWNPLRLRSLNGFDDESPTWYAGGTLVFTSDDRELIHRTRWGNTVRITLGDGSVSVISSVENCWWQWPCFV
jgi:hypothetical protein